MQNFASSAAGFVQSGERQITRTAPLAAGQRRTRRTGRTARTRRASSLPSGRRTPAEVRCRPTPAPPQVRRERQAPRSTPRASWSTGRARPPGVPKVCSGRGSSGAASVEKSGSGAGWAMPPGVPNSASGEVTSATSAARASCGRQRRTPPQASAPVVPWTAPGGSGRWSRRPVRGRPGWRLARLRGRP